MDSDQPARAYRESGVNIYSVRFEILKAITRMIHSPSAPLDSSRALALQKG
jgi:hypothetical protein